MPKFLRHLPLLLALLIFSVIENSTPGSCAQPPTYTRQANFTDHSQNYPTVPQNGTDLDNEYNAVKATLDAVLINLAKIQRDDGAIANGSIGIDQLEAGLTIGVNPVGNWSTATPYAVNDAVWENNILYRCAAAHTSGVFATDLGNGDWQSILDLSVYLAQAASSATAAATSATSAAASATTAASLAAQLTGTSATSNSIGTGSKTFATQSGKFFDPPANVLIYSQADSTNNLFGTVTGYSSGSLTVSVLAAAGTGTHTDWTINVSGARGAKGDAGSPGAGTGDMLGANNLSDIVTPATARTNLGVGIGVNVQAFDADLTALSQANGSANKLFYFTGSGTGAAVTYTSAARTFDAAVDAAAERTAMGLGSSSTLAAGTGANQVVQRDGSGHYPAGDGSAITGIGGGALTFVQSQTASSSSTLDFTGLTSGCAYYKFILVNLVPSSISGNLILRSSEDGGSTWDSSNGSYYWGSQTSTPNTYSGSNLNNTFNSSSTSTLSQYIPIVSNNSGSGVGSFSGEIIVYAPDQTAIHIVSSDAQVVLASTPFIRQAAWGQILNTAPVNGIRLLFTSGNIASGKAYEYCMKTS